MPGTRRNGSQLRAVAIFVVGTSLSVLTNLLTNNLLLDPSQQWARWILTAAVAVVAVLGAVLAWRTAAVDPGEEPPGPGAADVRTLSISQRWLVALVAAALAAGFSLIATQWPDLSKGGGIAVWMVVAALVIVTAAAVPWTWVFGSARRAGRRPPAGLTAREMLRGKVVRLWVEQALHRSLHHVVRIEVSLDRQPDAVADPWAGGTRLERLGTAEPLPDGARLSDFFGVDGVSRIVLVGAPGSGKTTHLLELAEDLCTAAATGPRVAIPVVLRLSEWTGRPADFARWVVAELGVRYDVSAAQASEWLTAGEIVLLLDGLDEVTASRRQRCVAALRDFCRDRRYAAALVVTCRTADYEMLQTRLPIDLGLQVRPLPQTQVRRILDGIGPPVEALRWDLDRNADLADLLTTPLMLGVAILATQGLPIGAEIPTSTMYSLYVRRMLRRQRTLRPTPVTVPFGFTDAVTFRSLVWLARLMSRQGRTAFYPDWVTPIWLPETSAPWPLPARRGPVAALARRIGWDHTSTAVVGGAYAAVFAAAAGAPLGAQIGGWWGVAILSACAAFVASVGVAVTFGVLMRIPRVEAYFTVILGKDSDPSYSAASWSWSWAKAVKGALVALIPGAVVFAIGSPLSSVAQGACVLGVIVLGGAISGGNVADNREPPASPGRALSASLRRLVLLIGVLSVTVLAVAAVTAALGGPWATIVAALPLTAAIMLVSGPGRAWLRNRAAYFGLQRSGMLPPHLFSFLLYADERILMRRVGGGFTFLHRTLQDYLADRDPEELATESSVGTGKEVTRL